MNPRELSLITSRLIDQSPMFNPLRRDTVIPTIYNGIVPTGAYLFNNLPTKPVYPKANNNKIAESDIHCLCQKYGVRMYDDIDGKVVPRNKSYLMKMLRSRAPGCC